MTESYLSVEGSSYHEYIIERSRFIAQAHYVMSEEFANNIILQTKQKYNDATHVCSAYVLGVSDNIYRFSDDGEPSKTAGMPILEAIRGRGLYHTLITVTRYFGGIKLGAGGLVRAYSSGALGAIDSAKIKKYYAVENFKLTLSYELYAVCIRYILSAEECVVQNTFYEEKISIDIAIKQTKVKDFINKLSDMSKGSAEFIKTDAGFNAFEK